MDCPLFRESTTRIPPFDHFRCHDDACPDRERCELWRYRDVYERWTDHVASGREVDSANDYV